MSEPDAEGTGPSLALRLVATIAGWLTLALLLAAITTVALFRQNAERELQQLLLANVYNVMGAIDVGTDGSVTASPNMGDPRFSRPSSGFVWAVSKASEPGMPLAHSASLTGEGFDVPDMAVQPFDDSFQRSYTHEEDGTTVQRLEAQLFIGDGDVLHQVMVSADRAPLDARVAAFSRTLAITFALLVISTVLVTLFAVRAGLRPLNEARAAVASLRDRRSGSVDGRFPREVEPLVAEINGLLVANRAVVDRARNQVGNLAHALKTPLAVLVNEARTLPAPGGPRIANGARSMEEQIRTYLDRAQRSQQRGGSAASVDVGEVFERLLRVMRKLHPDRTFDFAVSADTASAGIETSDLEELLGNLLDNAARHANEAIRVSVSELDAGTRLLLAIEDDGAGLGKEEIELALRRGERLDTRTPGSGLGLAIAHEIADDYGGSLELSRSGLGGLRAAVILPRNTANPVA